MGSGHPPHCTPVGVSHGWDISSDPAWLGLRGCQSAGWVYRMPLLGASGAREQRVSLVAEGIQHWPGDGILPRCCRWCWRVLGMEQEGDAASCGVVPDAHGTRGSTQARVSQPFPLLGTNRTPASLARPFAQHLCSHPGHLALSAMPSSIRKCLGITWALAVHSGGAQQEAGQDRWWGWERCSSPTLALVAVLICRDHAPDDASSVFPGSYSCIRHPAVSSAPPASPHPARGLSCSLGACAGPGRLCRALLPSGDTLCPLISLCKIR